MKIDGATIVALLALAGVIGTAIFTYLGQKQVVKAQSESNVAEIARGEIEQALTSQRERLDKIHTDYKLEIDAILAMHGREIANLKDEYESELRTLTLQIGELETRAEKAEMRADQAEEQATISASHAQRCDAALAELQAEHLQLRAQIEGMNRE
jgi:chromosome segregation ATPase